MTIGHTKKLTHTSVALKEITTYPVRTSDWTRLKQYVNATPTEKWSFRDICIAFLGAGVATLTAIWTGTIAPAFEARAYSFVLGFIACGVLAAVAAKREAKLAVPYNQFVGDLIKMIEENFDTSTDEEAAR